MSPGRVLVLTVVHHPLDARIYHRQIGALRAAGCAVTYAAPFDGYGVRPADLASESVTPVDVPRARGWHRLRSLLAARRLLRDIGPDHDVILLHDFELVLAVRGRTLPPVMWDVHEDTAAAVQVRPWIPDPLRHPIAGLVRWVERQAEGRFALLLADQAYADRFRRPHVVVPNTTEVPPAPGPGPVKSGGRYRAVYLGSITMERGAREMVAVARRLPPHVRLELIGPAHGAARNVIADAASQGVLDWHGFVPSDEALAMMRGALAGLCLLHDEANFRPSMATKVVEYLAHGVPAIVTPLPLQRGLVEVSGGGVVVPFGDVDAVVTTLQNWADEPQRARRLGNAGHQYVRAHYDWSTAQATFVGAVAAAARGDA